MLYLNAVGGQFRDDDADTGRLDADSGAGAGLDSNGRARTLHGEGVDGGARGFAPVDRAVALLTPDRGWNILTD